jgi:alcohol dehydrogenase class IV
VIEPFTSNAANPIVDALAKEGIVRAARSLRTVVANGQDIAAREDLAIASVLGGLSLANAKLGVVHGFASVLGGMYETAPHGAICAALLPHAFKMNVEKLLKKQETGDKEASYRLARFTEVAKLCTGNSNATAMDGVKWLAALNRDLAIPSLLILCEGMKVEDIPTIVKGTAEASSTKGNPIVLSESELEELLRKAM